MSDYRACFLIPCYNHGSTVANVVSSLESFTLPVLLVDDGSSLETKHALNALTSRDNLHLLTLTENQGKGGAVMAGIRYAHQLGFSHVIQIDADGQHDVQALPKLLAASQAQPTHLISGQPIYDESVPKARLYGRYATHIWVWIETLSLSIKDSMCGFRAYPVEKSIEVIDSYRIGKRMDFDIEILVRMYWQGVDIDFIETRVIYPEGGISHFDALWDNINISWMHTKLFFGMLPRIPRLVKRNFNRTQANVHWSKQQERGTVLGIKTLLFIYSLLGRSVFNLILRVVIGYYHLTGKQVKQASEHYLQQLREQMIVAR